MDGDGLQELVDALAERLQRSAAIDDPSIRLLAASRHFGDEDPMRVTSVLNRSVPKEVAASVFALGIAGWTEPGPVVVDPRFGLANRLCVPVRCNGLLLGYLWLIERDDAPLTPAEMEMAVDSASRAGVLLYRTLLLRERSRTRHEAFLRELVASDETARRQAVQDIWAELLLPDQAAVFQVMAVQRGPGSVVGAAQDVALEAAAEEGLRAAPDGSAWMVADRTRAWLLMTGAEAPSDARVRGIGDRISTRFRSLAGADARLVVGVGTPVGGLAEVVRSHREAFLAARAARLVSSLGDLAWWGRLGPYDVLLQLPEDAQARAAQVPALSTLVAADAHGVLLETLEAFLDHAGDVRRTAALLCVHRATLYHRLRRIEQLTGLSLDSGDDRLTLHLGVKCRGLDAAQQRPSEEPPAAVSP